MKKLKHIILSCAFTLGIILNGNAQTTPNNVPTNGLVAWYPFSGNAGDSSGNGNNGTVNGASFTTDRNGTANRAFSFNGTSNFIQVADANSLDLTNNYTLAGWFSTNDFTTTNLQTILGKGRPGGGTGYNLNYVNGNPNTVGSNANNGIGFNGGIISTIANNTGWHHVAVNYNGTQFKLYLDGVLRDSVSASFTLQNSTESLFIGRELSSLPRYFAGKLDDIGIWNRALSDIEIKRLYNPAGIFVQPKNIVTKASGSGSFIVQTADSGVTYQWQTNTGSGFTNLSNGGQYAGVNNDTLLVSNILQSNQNQQFRCLTFSGGFRDTSTIARIIIPNVPNNVPIDGLVGYWPFTGNAIDSSFNGNNGIVNGATLTTDRNGIANKAYSFNGSSNYIQGTFSNFPLSNNARTISGWINVDTFPSPFVNTLVSWGAPPNAGQASGLMIYDSTKLVFWSHSNDYFGTSNFRSNSWYHILSSIDEFGTCKLYVNGILLGTQYLSPLNTISNNNIFRFGKSTVIDSISAAEWVGYLKGKLDDIGIWSRALSANEIKLLYNPAGIFVQPKNILTKVNSSGSFIVQTADSGVTYQWQTNTGSGFTNLSNGGQYTGVNNDTLLVSNILQSNNNQQFRCLTSASLDKDTSTIARIIIPNVPNNVPINGLSAYWSFKGNGIDSSGNGNNLSAIGTINYATDRYGNTNSCTSFNGTGSGLFERTNSNLPGGNSTRTVSFWYKTTQSSSNQLVFCLWGGFDLCHSNFAALANTNSVYFWGKCEDKGFGFATSQDWVHIVLVYENNFMKLYRNGVLVNSLTDSYYNFTANLRTAINQFTVGYDPTSDFPIHFNGLIDDMAFWDRALSENEIKSLYNPAGIFVQPKNIVTKAPGSGSFIVQTADSGVSYQWQTNTGSGFTNLSNGGQFNGVNNDTLLVSNIQQSNNNQQFRCLTFAGLDRDTSTIARIIIPNVPQYVSINGLVGWWPFTGNAIDSSGNGNNGTVSGATLTTNRKAASNTAYSFNGSSNAIQVNHNAGLATTAATISAWIYPTNYQNGIIFGRSLAYPQLKLTQNGKVQLTLSTTGGSFNDLLSISTIPLNQWSLVVTQFYGDTMKLFINGALNAQTALSNAYTSYCNNEFFMGGFNYSSSSCHGSYAAQFYQGKLDDIGIWNRILTQEEISNLYISCDPKSSTFTASACNSYIWAAKGNKLYTASNNSDTLLYKIVGGCDSIVTLNLTIKQPTSSTSNISVCSSALPYTWNGRNYAANSVDTIKLVNAVGCDSVTILRLTVKPTSTSTSNISICPSALPYTWNGRNYTTSTVDTIKLVNALGCDSVTILRLTVKPTSTSTTNISICPSELPYTWNGRNYTTSSVDTIKLTNAVGCDSVTILRLTVKPTSTSTSNISICPSALPYTWNGRNYTTSSVDTIKLVNAVGCDSITILRLTVKPTSTSTTNLSICPSELPYSWNGRNYTTNSVDTIRLTNAVGCDSVTILRLTVKPTSTSTSNISICPSSLPYTWNGRNYNASTIDTIRLTNALGCDSITILRLSVSPTPNTSAIVGLASVNRLDTTSYSVSGLSGSTFNWNAQGANIEAGSGTNKIRIKWLTMGTQQITVTETSNQGCVGVQKTLTVNVGPATGVIESTSIGSIEIYPNPTTGNVNMKVDVKLIGSNYAVIDVLGKTVLSGNIKTNEETLNLENVSAGIYFINVGDNLKQTFKIIKE